MASDLPLFRKEVAEHKAARRVFGTVSLAPPRFWRYFGLALCFGALAFVLVMTFGTYSVTVAAEGHVVPQLGLARVEAPADMTVIEIAVRKGQRVRRGDLVARLATTPNVAAEPAAPAHKQLAALERERKILLSQMNAVQQRFEHSDASLRVELDSLRMQLSTAEDESKILGESIRIGQNLLAAIEPLEEQQLVSRFEVDARRQDVASRIVSRNAIVRESAALGASIAAKESELLSADNSATESLAPLRQRLEELERLEADIRSASVIAVRSPIDGRVSLLRARTGELVREHSLLAVLVPEGTGAEVEAFVPAAQARRIREGQRVRVSFSQFPVGQFGMVDGTVVDAPSIAIRREDVLIGGQPDTDGFLVRIALTDNALVTDDMSARVSLGTRAVANIIVDRQPLAGLLLGPLKQAASRLHTSRNGSELDALR